MLATISNLETELYIRQVLLDLVYYWVIFSCVNLSVLHQIINIAHKGLHGHKGIIAGVVYNSHIAIGPYHT